MLRGDLRTSEISVRVEPWLNRAVNFAHGLGLVEVTKGKSVALTEKGVRRRTRLTPTRISSWTSGPSWPRSQRN